MSTSSSTTGKGKQQSHSDVKVKFDFDVKTGKLVPKKVCTSPRMARTSAIRKQNENPQPSLTTQEPSSSDSVTIIEDPPDIADQYSDTAVHKKILPPSQWSFVKREEAKGSSYLPAIFLTTLLPDPSGKLAIPIPEGDFEEVIGWLTDGKNTKYLVRRKDDFLVVPRSYFDISHKCKVKLLEFYHKYAAESNSRSTSISEK